MEVNAVVLLLFFIFAWYRSDDISFVETLRNKFVDVRLEVPFPLAWRQLRKSAFQLFEVLPGPFFLLSHAYSAPGIHSS